jgi:hypothetical protein
MTRDELMAHVEALADDALNCPEEGCGDHDLPIGEAIRLAIYANDTRPSLGDADLVTAFGDHSDIYGDPPRTPTTLDCDYCDGYGWDAVQVSDTEQEQRQCSFCEGTGRVSLPRTPTTEDPYRGPNWKPIHQPGDPACPYIACKCDPRTPTTAAGRRFCEGPRPTGNWWKGVPAQIAAIEAEARAPLDMAGCDANAAVLVAEAVAVERARIRAAVEGLTTHVVSGYEWEHVALRDALRAAIEGSKE